MTTTDSRPLGPRLYRAGKLFAFAMALLASADLTAFLCSRYIRINRSPSLPLGLYRPVALPLGRGRLVSACLPLSVTRLGRARSYLPPGPCPGDSAPVLKYIAGLPGDVIEVTSSGITANGVPLLFSGAIQEDSRGRSLSPVPPGRYRLRDCYWLAAPHVQSWDSRYFGCVSRESLREVLVPWVTTTPPQPVGDFRARKSGGASVVSQLFGSLVLYASASLPAAHQAWSAVNQAWPDSHQAWSATRQAWPIAHPPPRR